MKLGRTTFLRGWCRGATALCLLVGTHGCTTIVDRVSGRDEACRILATGEATTAVIVRLVDTGTTINDDPVVDLQLEVVGSGGEAYEATARVFLSRLDIPAFQPGRILPVKVDPVDRRRLAVDLGDCSDR